MKMKRAYIIISLLCLFATLCKCEYELQIKDINNLTMYSRRFDACRELDPEACCFKDNVQLTVQYDENQIYSFKFTGTQVGKNCDGTLVVYPTKYSSTQKTILQGSFSVTDLKGIFSYTFFSSYREYTENGDLKADYELDARAPSQKYQLDQYFVFTKTLSKGSSSSNSTSPSPNPEISSSITSRQILIFYLYLGFLSFFILL